jgi:putative DNA primase/helicase
MRMLLIELCAAADHARRSPHDPQFDTVVVLQGPQGIGKSRFCRELMPPELAPFFRGGRSLNPGDKDSLLAALSALVVELGELDATFRKADIAALKAFLSLDVDQIRRPYARGHEQMQRRTVFVATVNVPDFLTDDTGNRRFVPVPIDSIDFATLKQIAIEQVLAEAWHRYLMGEQWWPTPAEKQLIAPARAGHEKMRPHEERLLMHYDFSTLPDPLPAGWENDVVPGIHALTATQIATAIGFDAAARHGDVTSVGIALAKINQDQDQRPRRGMRSKVNVWAIPMPSSRKSGP